MAILCPARISDATWENKAQLQTAFQGVAICLRTAAKAAFQAAAANGVRAFLGGAIEAFGRGVQEGQRLLLAFVDQFRAPLPDFEALRALAVRPAQLLADATRGRFLELARPCVQRVPDTASSFAAIQAVTKATVACVLAASSSAFGR